MAGRRSAGLSRTGADRDRARRAVASEVARVSEHARSTATDSALTRLSLFRSCSSSLPPPHPPSSTRHADLCQECVRLSLALPRPDPADPLLLLVRSQLSPARRSRSRSSRPTRSTTCVALSLPHSPLTPITSSLADSSLTRNRSRPRSRTRRASRPTSSASSLPASSSRTAAPSRTTTSRRSRRSTSSSASAAACRSLSRVRPSSLFLGRRSSSRSVGARVLVADSFLPLLLPLCPFDSPRRSPSPISHRPQRSPARRSRSRSSRPTRSTTCVPLALSLTRSSHKLPR